VCTTYNFALADHEQGAEITWRWKAGPKPNRRHHFN